MHFQFAGLQPDCSTLAIAAILALPEPPDHCGPSWRSLTVRSPPAIASEATPAKNSAAQSTRAPALLPFSLTTPAMLR
jgi:hypothetical protein